jgi:hypothetical protein
MPAVTEPERPLEAWETSAPGPCLTIRTAGVPDGPVTTTRQGSEGRVAVEATRGTPSIFAELVGHATPDELGQAWANELAAGRGPQTD